MSVASIQFENSYLESAQNTTSLHAMKSPPIQFMSDHDFDITSLYVVIATAFCSVVGLCSNLVIIFVFFKMGLNRPSNICFFSLAIADFISLSWILLLVLSQNPLHKDGRILIPLSDLAIILSPVGNSLTAFAAWVTTILSLERSCCIVFPLKVKQVFTKKTTVILLLWMLLYQIATATPFYFSFQLIKVTSLDTGWSRIEMDRRSHDTELAVLSKTISFSIPTVVCFFIVVIATLFLIKSLRESRRTRQEMVGSKSEEKSTKDARVIKTVIIICGIFIVGFFLKVTNFIVSMIYPSFHVFDPYLGNLCSLLILFGNLFYTASCSINIVVYFKMNSAFKQSVKATFFCEK